MNTIMLEVCIKYSMCDLLYVMSHLLLLVILWLCVLWLTLIRNMCTIFHRIFVCMNLDKRSLGGTSDKCRKILRLFVNRVRPSEISTVFGEPK